MKPYPKNLEAERALLGGAILDPTRIGELDGIRPEHFHRTHHGRLWEILVDMYVAGNPIDTVTVPEAIAIAGVEEEVGGIGYVLALPDSIPSTENLGYYAKIVKRDSDRRAGINLATESIAALYDRHEDPRDVIERMTGDLLGMEFGIGRSGWASVAELANDRKDEILEFAALPAEERRKLGTMLGYADLDRHLGGIHKGDLFILAGRPGMGKTAFALGIAERVSKGYTGQRPKNVAFFSLEMSREQLTDRLLGMRGRVPIQAFRTGNLRGGDEAGLEAARSHLQHTSIWIDDQPALTLAQIAARTKRLHATLPDGLDLIVVDYLQLMAPENPRASRDQQVGDCTRGLKALAKGIAPVLCLSQLNRSVEQRNDKRPQMSDLRESGAIEQDADTILFVYRPDYYYSDLEDQHKGVAEVIIAKNRHGGAGTVRLAFEGEFTRFDDLARMLPGMP